MRKDKLSIDSCFLVLTEPSMPWALLSLGLLYPALLISYRTTEWLMLKETLPTIPGFDSSFVCIHPLLWQMPPLIIDLSILLYESQAVLLPGSTDLSPASVIVLHLIPNLHQAWLTASPVISRVGTRAKREWRIKQVHSKHFPTKSFFFFFLRVCGNRTVHIKKCHEIFISALQYNTVHFGVSCKIHWAKNGALMRLFHILAYLCLVVASCIVFLSAQALVDAKEHAYDKWEPLQMYDAVGELYFVTFKAVVQTHLTFHHLCVFFSVGVWIEH